MRTTRVAGLLLLAGACAVGAARAPSDTETRQLQQEVRALKQEILTFKPPVAAHGRKAADAAAHAARPILAKFSALAAEMTTGKYKAAAAELLLESPSVRASHGGMVDCAKVKKSFEDKAPNFWTAAMDSGDCGVMAMSGLMEAATSGSGSLTGDALKARVEKVCSMEGAASATSCGETSPLAVLSKLARKWSNAKGISACGTGGNSTTPIASMLAVGMYADLICAKDGADYCVAKGGGLSALTTAGDNVNQESLDSMCSPCTMKTVGILARIMMMADPSSGDSGSEGEDMQQMAMMMLTSMLKTLCAKDQDDSYCALKQGSLAATMLSDSSGDAEPSPTQMCSFCGKKIMGGMMSMIPDKEEKKSMSRQMTAFCFKKEGDSKYCGDYIASDWEKITKDCGLPEDPVLGTIPSADPTCSDTCKPTIAAMKLAWGCCAGTLAKAASTEFNTYLGKLYTACGETLDGACAGGKPLSFKAKVANLKDAWMTAASENPALVSELVGTDASQAMGVVPEFITVTGTAMANGGTELKINMEFPTQEESDSVKAAFKAAYGSRRAGKISFESLELLPADAKVDPEAKMSVEVDATIEDGVSNMVVASGGSDSGSSAVQASMSVLLGALVLVLGLFCHPM